MRSWRCAAVAMSKDEFVSRAVKDLNLKKKKQRSDVKDYIIQSVRRSKEKAGWKR